MYRDRDKNQCGICPFYLECVAIGVFGKVSALFDVMQSIQCWLQQTVDLNIFDHKI